MTRRQVLVLILLLVTADVRGAGADDRLERIILLWPSRDFDTLRVRLNEALTAYREARDPRREATVHLLLSLVDTSLGDGQTARLHFGEATTRLEAAGDYVGAGLAYWMFAEHERLSERQSDHVRAFYEKSLAMLEKAKSPSAPFSIDALLIVGPVVGLPPAEYEPNAATPEINKPIVLQLLEVFARTGYGAEFLRIGELEKADAQLRQAKEAAAIFGGRVDPPIDRHIGNLRRRQWRLDQARESYRKALEGLKVLRPVGILTPKRLKVEVFGELAELEMLSGRIDDALAWNDRALELVRAEKSPETEIVVLRRRAETLVRGGRFNAAEKMFAQALALAEEHEHFYLQVSIYLSSAQMNKTRGRYGAAAADMEKSLEALARANEPFREPAILGNLAMNYILLDADDSARLALERARQVAEKNGRCLDVAAIDLLESTRKYLKDEISFADFYEAVEQWSRTPDALSVPGSEHLAQLMNTIVGSAPADPQLPFRSGMLSEGMVELLQAGALFSQGRDFALVRELAMKALVVIPNAKHRAGALAMIGGTYVAEGDDDKGITYFNKAIDALDTATEDARVDPFLSSSPGAAGWSSSAFEILIQLLVRHRRHEEAFAVSERARARVFLQMMGNTRVSPRGPENTLPAQEAEALRAQMLQWQQHARLAPTRQINDDLREARRRYEALMTRVKATNPDYAAMTSVEPLRLDAIREELPSNTTLVSYFVTDNAAHAWALDRTTLQYVSLPFGRMALERAQCAATRFRIGGRGVRPLNASCEPATVEELYGRLFAPLRVHIRNSRLVVVPHGVLHYLPFGAFRDPRTERYLIEDYTITYAPSASSIRFLRDKETPVKGKALVIGAPAGVSPELPGAMREAMIVGTKLRSVPMIGAAAKESLLYQLKGDVDLVHIAAHGFYEADTPLFSRLALAEGDGSDGNLEVHEILSDVDLTGVNLVVLSACQTALGKGSAGDEIVGLTRALLYAGTPGVISTLWDIGDDAAAALMNHFYSRLLDGDSAADALRHAQLQLLHGDYPDPRHWAAFTLNGDPEGRWNASGAVTAAEK
ncbi:MAG TPA: CHAT domain-containing tetratricopeptide repeat protein [Thermoanaerobaculia bacterium]|nr:CHAT domain-containing tetratricopeptide repeat protein [Thermoanaerobaculia bacterium]